MTLGELGYPVLGSLVLLLPKFFGFPICRLFVYLQKANFDTYVFILYIDLLLNIYSAGNIKGLCVICVHRLFDVSAFPKQMLLELMFRKHVQKLLFITCQLLI